MVDGVKNVWQLLLHLTFEDSYLEIKHIPQMKAKSQCSLWIVSTFQFSYNHDSRGLLTRW